MKPSINVLLIDDNPKHYSAKLNEAKAIGLVDSNITCSPEDVSIPVIKFIGENAGLEKHFNLMHLKSPVEIKEFISFNLEIEDKFTSVELGSIGLIPNIIAFDYYLREEMDKPLVGINKENQSVLQYLNPNYKLLNYLKNNIKDYPVLNLTKELNPDYRDADLLIDGFNEYEKKREDNLGLLAGVEIARLFRNYTCVGLPVTFKPKDKLNLNPEAFFFEFINDYEFGSMFNREHRTNKDWEKIIFDGTRQLRNRINDLVKSNKITPSIGQLMKLADENTDTDYEDEIFTYHSDYGKHSLPVMALFIDITKANRKESIQDYFDALLKSLIQNAKAGIDKGVLGASMKTASELMDAYRQEDSFFKRIRYSQIAHLKEKKETVADDLETEFIELKNFFEIGKKYFSIDTKKCNSNEKVTKRLAALFTMLEVYSIYQKYMNENGSEIIEEADNYLLVEPDIYDYYFALYPRPETPLILPIHNSKTRDTLDTNLMRITDLMVNAIIGRLKKGTIVEANNTILPEEKPLLRAYALELGLEWGKPFWIF